MTGTRDGRDIVERLRALSNSIADEAADIIEAHRNSIDALVAGWNKDRAGLIRLRSQRVAVPEPVAFCEIIDGKVVSVRLDKSRHCTVPLFAHQPAQDGWQDISTAPKDGTWFLAWGPLWRHPFPAKFLGPTTTLVWIDTCEAEARGRHEYATHWMPRPTPPSAAIRSLAHGDSNDR